MAAAFGSFTFAVPSSAPGSFSALSTASMRARAAGSSRNGAASACKSGKTTFSRFESRPRLPMTPR
jgi:hypothetical protein